MWKTITDTVLLMWATLLKLEHIKQFLLKVRLQKGQEPYAEMKVLFDYDLLKDMKETFKTLLADAPKSDTKLKFQKFKFLMYSPRVILTFDYHVKHNELIFTNLFKKELESHVDVRFSRNRKLFYVPMGHNIKVWDSTLRHLLYIFDTHKIIDETILLDDKNSLLVYDRAFYYDLDLDRFKIRRKLAASSNSLDFRLLLDFNMLPPSTDFSATFHTKIKHSLSTVEFAEPLSLKRFPFEDLAGSFLKKGYPKHVRAYAEYYFHRLEVDGRKDFIYGSLNPLLFAIYHNDSSLLEELLEKHYYPKQISNYVSPLEYSFALNYQTTIKVLCDNMIRRDDFVHFSRADFKNLLKSNILTCHKLLATIPSPPEADLLPRLVYMTSKSKTIFQSYLSSLLVQLKIEDQKFTSKDLSQSNSTSSHLKETELGNDFEDLVKFDSESYYSPGQKEARLAEEAQEIQETTEHYVKETKKATIFKSEVTITTVPFKFNYGIGTGDSVAFVHNYANSTSQEFILSDWKEIIKWKWQKLKLPLYLMMAIYFLYFLMFALSAVIYTDNKGLRGMAVIMNILMITIEVVEMITFLVFKPKSYFLNWENYFDWIIYICTFLYSAGLHLQDASDGVMIFVILVLILLFYRGFIYLRIIGIFTALITMIIIILRRLIAFFFMLAFTYLGVVLILVKLRNDCRNCPSTAISFRDVYYWIFLGSVEADAFDTPLAAIPVIFGTVFLTIVLLNILIAFLSNEFSRLEERQKIQELKERAALIMNFEVLTMFFKYVVTKKIRLRNQFELEKYRLMLKNENAVVRSGKQNKIRKALKDYLAEEKILYIFRKVDLDLIEDQENLYQKIKSLEKKAESLMGLVSRRSRSQEVSIEQVRKVVKSNSNSQEKTIDDLKRLMSENSNKVADNTETLIIDISKQQEMIHEFMGKLVSLESKLRQNNKNVAKLVEKKK